MSTTTTTYSAIHAAYRRTAAGTELAATEIRVLVAIAERGGAAVTDELEADLACNDSILRRALLNLYIAKRAPCFASDGGPRRPGCRSRAELTDQGRALVDEFRGHLSDLTQSPTKEAR